MERPQRPLPSHLEFTQPDDIHESNTGSTGRRLVGGIVVIGVAATAFFIGGAHSETAQDWRKGALSALPFGGDDEAAATPASTSAASPAETSVATPSSPSKQKSEQACIADMPLNKRVGQVMMPGFDVDHLQSAATVFKKYRVGNAIVMGDIQGNDKSKLKNLADTSHIALGVDDEGGVVQRTNKTLESQQAISSKYTPDQAKEIIADHAAYLKAMGMTYVTSPVLDVNRANGTSGTPGKGRTFQGSANQVATYGQAYIDAITGQGLIAVPKHFPGHGGATGDTHVQAASTAPWAVMKKRDLVPFKKVIEQTTDADKNLSIMIGHMTVPGLTEPQTPASLSRKAVNVLRQDLGFDGIVMTDSLTMAAALTNESLSGAAVKALVAGSDIALFVPKPEDLESDTKDVSQAIKNAVKNGTLPEKQLNQSVGRILRAQSISVC